MKATHSSSPITRWLRTPLPQAAASVNLICLPHAGGSASFYREWGGLLPPEVEFHVIQYPGRQDRLEEPCIDTMMDMADAVADAIRPAFARDVVLFGHSMGAAIGYEVARRCESAGLVPRLLIASGRSAPHRQRTTSLHTQGDDALLSELRRHAATSDAVLDDPELRRLLFPMIRADYRLIERYRVDRPTPLRTQIAVFHGRTDSMLDHDQVVAWSELTTGGFERIVFDGGHFYLQGQEKQVIDAALSLLSNLAIGGIAPEGRSSYGAWPLTPHDRRIQASTTSPLS